MKTVTLLLFGRLAKQMSAALEDFRMNGSRQMDKTRHAEAV